MAATIDTLRIAKTFRDARSDEERAEAFAAGLREVQEGQLTDLVTKPEFRAGLAELRGDLRVEMGELRSELRAEMGELRGELRAEIAELRGEFRAEIADVRKEITELRGEMRTGFAEVRGEVARASNRLLFWLLPLLFAQTGAVLWLVVRRDLGLP